MANECCRHGGHDAAVDAARDEQSVRDVAHELPVHRRFEGVTETGGIEGVVRQEPGLRPLRFVVPLEPLLPLVAQEEVAGGHLLDALAGVEQPFHLGRDVQALVAIPADVQRVHADRVPRDQIRVARRVVDHEREDAVDAVQEVPRVVLVVEVEQHLAVRARLELVGSPEPSAQVLVVVDLAVDRQHVARERIDERLRAVLDVHDREPLMGEDGPVARPDAAPVGPAVPQLPARRERLPPELAQVGPRRVDVENGRYSAHNTTVPSSRLFRSGAARPGPARRPASRLGEGPVPWRLPLVGVIGRMRVRPAI
jgi:hypothetical protein